MKIKSDYSLFDSYLQKAILQSERLRLAFLAIVFFCIAFFILLYESLLNKYFTKLLYAEIGGIPLYLLITFCFVIYGFSAIFIRYFYRVMLERNIPHRKSLRYINAILEISLPTLLILIVYVTYNSVTLLFVPQVSLYFLFIIFSVMRLDWKLSVLTGFVSAFQYIAFALYAVNNYSIDSVPLLLTSLPVHAGRVAVLILAGLAAGFISVQMKKRVTNVFNLMNEREKILNTFGQHVSPEVVNKLLDHKTEMISEKTYVCVMFLDIRNFTGFSEGKNPDEIINYLNYIFSFMIEIINRNNGIINKFLGDGFMAIFGVPFSEGHERSNAVTASMELISRLENEIKKGAIPETKIGIGIHSGYAVTGTVGSKTRQEYTVIGDVVNIASRIEPLNKQYDSTLIVSSEVLEAANNIDIQTEDLGFVKLRGHIEQVKLYRVI